MYWCLLFQYNCLSKNKERKLKSTSSASDKLFSLDSPGSRNADARSTGSKTSINVKIPSGQSTDLEQKKKVDSPRRKSPTHMQVLVDTHCFV